MKKQLLSIIVALLVLGLIGATSATPFTNWDISVSDGSLFCDSKSSTSTQGVGPVYASSFYRMALLAPDANIHLTYYSSLDDSNIQSDVILNVSSFSNQKKVIFEESVGSELIINDPDNASCFSMSSEASALTSQIDLDSSTSLDNFTANHSISAEGLGDFGLSASSYNIYGALNGTYNVESSSNRLKIYDADFSVNISLTP